jgi:hypothetical protein
MDTHPLRLVESTTLETTTIGSARPPSRQIALVQDEEITVLCSQTFRTLYSLPLHEINVYLDRDTVPKSIVAVAVDPVDPALVIIGLYNGKVVVIDMEKRRVTFSMVAVHTRFAVKYKALFVGYGFIFVLYELFVTPRDAAWKIYTRTSTSSPEEWILHSNLRLEKGRSFEPYHLLSTCPTLSVIPMTCGNVNTCDSVICFIQYSKEQDFNDSVVLTAYYVGHDAPPRKIWERLVISISIHITSDRLLEILALASTAESSELIYLDPLTGLQVGPTISSTYYGSSGSELLGNHRFVLKHDNANNYFLQRSKRGTARVDSTRSVACSQTILRASFMRPGHLALLVRGTKTKIELYKS